MRKLIILVALWMAKSAMWLARVSGKGKGSSLPGMVAIKIYPAILSWFASQLRYGAVMVTGTNGKTTTNNMLASIVKAGGYKVLINHEGANLITGVTTAFIRASDFWGRIKCDYALLEADEAAFPAISARVRPKVVVITNFFRDQLDRYGELGTTIKMIKQALDTMPDVKLVLNADDPLVSGLGQDSANRVLYYGLSTGDFSNVSIGADAREAKLCPLCGQALKYRNYIYSQLGDYSCQKCTFNRPVPGMQACNVDRKKGFYTGLVTSPVGNLELAVPAEGIYNYYNALAALSTSLELKIDPFLGARILRNYVPATGRMERFRYKSKQVILNLVKNPTGFNQALSVLLNQEEMQDVLVAINDNDADGRDISWLWDVDFEILERVQYRFASFICTGKRAAEMAVRLKYAGISTELIYMEEDLEKAVDKVIEGKGQKAFLLTTYTALWPLEAVLVKRAKRVDENVEGMPSVS